MTRATLFCLFSLFIRLAPSAYGNLPPELQAELNRLPEKKLTLSLILGAAIQNSDHYRINVGSQYPLTEVATLQGQSALAPKFTFETSLSDDKSQAISNFQSSRTRASQFKVATSKLFSTGTQLSAEILHSYTELGFSSGAELKGFETKGTLSLSQNLWKDAFGRSTQLNLQAAQLASESARAGFQLGQEEWVLGFVQIYYQAWLAQAESKAAEANVQRRNRLLQITRRKRKRGTAEQPDLLQVESAFLGAQVLRSNEDQVLSDRWRELVISVKLPSLFLGMDPKWIPIDLDDPMKQARATCGPEEKLKIAPIENAATRQTQLALKAAEAKLRVAKNNFKPSLALGATVSSNGVDANSRGPSFDSTFSGDHPGWMIGLTFSMPFSFEGEEAEIRTALSEKIKAEAQASQAIANLQLDWLKACSNFHRLQRAYRWLSDASKNQSRRAKLEEERFRIGRVNTITVIQAGDDATEAQKSLNRGEVERRIAAWQVMAVSGQFQKNVAAMTGLSIKPPKDSEIAIQ